MKGLFSTSLLIVFLVLFPAFGLAAPLDSELEDFLNETQLSKEQLEDYLDFYDLSITDFETIEELTDFLGPVLTEDLLTELLEQHELTLEEATALLIANGELEEGQSILDVYVFVDELDVDLYFYNLTPITEDNLQELLDLYGLTKDELVALLSENGDSLDNYEYIEDLEMAVDFYLYYDYEDADLEFSEIEDLFNQIGLTDEELDNLFQHFLTLDFENPAFLEELERLSERMMAFEDFEDVSDISAEQIAELLDIYTQLLNLFELDVKYYLVKDDEKKPVSLSTLMTMTSTNGYGLFIELYNKQGVLLADLFFTADMFGPEIIQETGQDLKKTEEVITKHVEKKAEKKDAKKVSKKPVTKTEKGAKLPKTASNYLSNASFGLALVFIGFVVYRRFNGRHA